MGILLARIIRLGGPLTGAGAQVIAQGYISLCEQEFQVVPSAPHSRQRWVGACRSLANSPCMSSWVSSPLAHEVGVARRTCLPYGMDPRSRISLPTPAGHLTKVRWRRVRLLGEGHVLRSFQQPSLCATRAARIWVGDGLLVRQVIAITVAQKGAVMWVGGSRTEMESIILCRSLRSGLLFWIMIRPLARTVAVSWVLLGSPGMVWYLSM